MVTARVAIGSVSALAIGAILLGSAPYWLHRSGSGAKAAPWGAIQSLETTHAEAAPSPDRDQLLKLAALKSGASAEVPAASVQAEPTPQPATTPMQAAVLPETPSPQPAAPVNESQQVASAEPPAAADSTVVDGADTSDRININTASSSALDHLPGAGRIGHAIISHRPYKTTKDLVSRRILRLSDFQKIQAHIGVD